MSQVISKFKNKITNSLKDKAFNEILSGSMLTFGAKIIGVILGFALHFIIARYYGAESMGVYSIINSVLMIALLFSLQGSNIAILRFIPEHIEKYSIESSLSIFKQMVYIVFFFSLFVSTIVYAGSDFIANYFFHDQTLIPLLSLAVFFILLQAIGSLNMEAIRAFKSVNVYALMQIVPPLTKLIILLLLTGLFYQSNNPVYALLYSHFGLAIISIIALWYVLKNKKPINKTDNKIVKLIKIKDLFVVSFPMFLTSAMYIVMSQTDILMLGSLSTMADVGVYAVVVKLATLTVFILTSINAIVAPKFSELYHSGKVEELKNIAQKSSKLMFWGSLPIIIINIFFGIFILQLFGDEFSRGYYALLFLTIGYFVNSLVGSVGYLLNMSGHQKEFNKIIIFGGLVNIVLNYFLIPVYGIYGAAFGSMISMVLWNLLATVFIKKIFGFYIFYLPVNLKIKG